MLRVVGVLALAAALTACSRAPTLRSVVYEEFGRDAIVLTPKQGVPLVGSDYYNNNRFHYVPGALAAPKEVERSRDDIRRRVAVWNHRSGDMCQHFLYRLSNTTLGKPKDIIKDYHLDATFPSILFTWLPRAEVRESYAQLDDNEFGSLKHVSIKLTNIRRYSANDKQLDDALKQIKGRNCYPRLAGYGDAIQVKEIISGNVEVAVERATGVNIKAPGFKALVEKNFELRSKGSGLIFAVIPR